MYTQLDVHWTLATFSKMQKKPLVFRKMFLFLTPFRAGLPWGSGREVGRTSLGQGSIFMSLALNPVPTPVAGE